MSIQIIKMSSKGQIVIPKLIRDGLRAGEGSVFAVVSQDDTLILKKMETPSKEWLIRDLDSIAKAGKARLQKKGIKEEDIPYIVEKSRKQ